MIDYPPFPNAAGGPHIQPPADELIGLADPASKDFRNHDRASANPASVPARQALLRKRATGVVLELRPLQAHLLSLVTVGTSVRATCEDMFHLSVTSGFGPGEGGHPACVLPCGVGTRVQKHSHETGVAQV